MPRRAARLAYPLLLAAGLAALLIGWSTAGSPAASGPTRYVEGVVGAPGPVNPLLITDPVAGDLAALLFNGLMRIAGDGTPVPDLAERWDVTPDGRTYTFVLRRGVTWHDGVPFDARDVAFTIGLLQSPDFPGPAALAAPWTHADVFVADALTLLVRLEEPAADFLAHAAVGIVPAHLLSDVEPDGLPDAGFNTSPVGTGPYRLLRLDGRSALLERNTSYHLGAPAIDAIELRFLDSAASLRRALARGEVGAGLLDESWEGVEPLLDQRVDLVAQPLRRSAYALLYLNNQSAPLDDLELRRALLASLDRGALLARAGARGLVGDGVIVPGSWAHSALESQDAPRAEALWQAAGWRLDPSGLRVDTAGRHLGLTLLVNSDPLREALASGVAGQLRAHGVEVTVEVVSAAELLQRYLQPRSYQMAIFGWEAAVDPDPYAGWHGSQVAAHGRNIAAYHDANSDALLEAARATLDLSERGDLYARFAEIFQEQAASLVLYYPERPYIRPTALEGVTDGLLFTPAGRFRDVHLWRLAE